MFQATKKVVLLLLVCLSGLALSAQTPQTIQVDVGLVNLVVTVTDANGKLVSDLTADDFTIYEDGAAQKIVHFTQDRDVPVNVGILLDTSGSMSGKMASATEAINQFLQNIHKDDDIFLMTFSNGVDVAQDFTSDRKKLARALASLRIGGGTQLYDGLEKALSKLEKGKHDKKAILLLSDGVVGSNKARIAALEDRIHASEALIYALGTGQATYADPSEHVSFELPTSSPPANRRNRGGGNTVGRGTPPPQPPQSPPRGGPPPIVSQNPSRLNPVNGVDMNVLTQVAESSGGQAYPLSKIFLEGESSEIHKILTSIADELRSQYTLGYYPPSRGDIRFHEVRVQTKAGHTVRARKGYLDPAQIHSSGK